MLAPAITSGASVDWWFLSKEDFFFSPRGHLVTSETCFVDHS